MINCQKIYVSLTTIPSRINNLYNTINSLLAQTVIPDKIVVNIPSFYYRFPEIPVIPDFLSNNVKVTVHRCIDYGPATKLLGLFSFPDINDDDILIICDDDRNYDNFFVEDLINGINIYQGCAVTNVGWEIEEMSQFTYVKKNFPRGINFQNEGFADILGGCCGFAIKYGYLSSDKDILNISPTNYQFYVDDVWISGFLAKNGISILIISTKKDAFRNVNNSIQPLAVINGTFNRDKCNNESIKYFIENYDVWKNEPLNNDIIYKFQYIKILNDLISKLNIKNIIDFDSQNCHILAQNNFLDISYLGIGLISKLAYHNNRIKFQDTYKMEDCELVILKDPSIALLDICKNKAKYLLVTITDNHEISNCYPILEYNGKKVLLIMGNLY